MVQPDPGLVEAGRVVAVLGQAQPGGQAARGAGTPCAGPVRRGELVDPAEAEDPFVPGRWPARRAHNQR